jgi:DNA-binding GntR family transcriptional regulator
MLIERQIPIADQVANLLHERIVEGIYTPTERLPSESDLAEELGVSRGTVRSALTALATAGLIVRRQGDGTYVRDGLGSENSLMHVVWEFTRFIEFSGRAPAIQVVSLDSRSATEQEALALELPPEASVLSIVRIISADDQPVIVSTNVHPASLFSQGLEELDATIELRRFLEKYCHREVVFGDMDISATMPDEAVRKTLSLDGGTPILLVEAVFRDGDGCPLVLATSYYADAKLSLQDVRRLYPWSRSG